MTVPRSVGTRRRSRPRPRTARGTALQALVAIEKGARANVVVADLLSAGDLEARDRHLVTELVYGASRMRRACDWLTGRYSRGRLDTEVRSALRLGAYQLGWTRIPAHAAVAATVAEIPGPGRSVVNAVLRRVASDVERGLVTWPDLQTELSYPDWIVDVLTRDLGASDALAALKVMNDPATVHLRADGYIQDPASQMVGSHLEALMAGSFAGSRILDLCAAPGGKATALAGSPSLVVANDISSSRTRLVLSNVERLGAKSVLPVVADGCRPCYKPGSFDMVLVDAPCSGLGVLRRRADARWRVRPEDPETLGRLQRRLLSAAGPLVRPGGILAYSVCTMTASETAAIDNWLAASAPELAPLPPPGEPWRNAGRGGLLLPHSAGTDGMYLLALRVPSRR